MRLKTITTVVALTLGLAAAPTRPVLAKKPPTPPPAPVLAPYSGTPVAIPGTVNPERYDLGGEGLAYHDTDATNTGGAFRTDGVDLQAASFGGYNVGWTNPGEYLNYTVTVTASGTYVVTLKVASPTGGAQLHVGFNGPSAGTWNAVAIPATGDWQTWTTVQTTVALKAGVQQLTIKADTAGFNLGTIAVAVATTPPPPPPPPTTCTDPAATNYGGPLPCVYPPTPPPPPPPPPGGGNVIRVPAGGDLQAALNAAQGGDTILLAPGATYTGNFVLPAKSNAVDVTIATDGTLPAIGTRVTPAMAPNMAKLRSGNTGAALATVPYAQHYTLRFVDVLSNAGGYGEAISLGDGSAAQNSLTLVPHDFTLEQLYVHGDNATGQKRGIGLNAAAVTIRDSWIDNMWAAGQDSQAICGWNGPGPFTIDNNYLEAASENILFGGADPSIPNLIPSDITITRNYVTKRMAWFGTTDRSIKNLLEFKAGQRVRVEGNIFENNWSQAQSGYAILFTGRSQDGAATWNVVRDVLFTNNVVRHVAAAINILGHDYYFASGTSHNLEFSNNLFEDVSRATFGGDGRFVLLNDGYDYRFTHNTILQDGSAAIYVTGVKVPQVQIANNLIVTGGDYGIMGDGAAPGNGTIATWLPTSTILQNGIAGIATPWTFPTGNFYPPAGTDVGFVAFKPLTGGNYRLAPSSIYRAAGTDGKDLGVDFDALNAALGTTY